MGCGVIIESQKNVITNVLGDPDHPANFGRLCSKGSTLHLTATPSVTRQTRLLQPLRRLSRSSQPTPIDWKSALHLAAQRFASIINEHGPDSVGFYLSGQLLTEDYYVFNKLVKGLIGTNNLDTNSRLCMSSAVSGYKATLGMDAPPASYEDFDHTDCLFISGSNTAWAHPIIFRRIEQAKRNKPDLKIIVVDPRRTDTVELADLHLALKPGTDVMLYNGLLHIMQWEGWIKPDFISKHTNGFEKLKNIIRDCTPERTAKICGLRTEDLFLAAKWFACSAATLSLYCQGLNQSSHGTDNNTALINLHLATAQLGRAGAAPFSLTGQPNAMGGREVGGLSNLLSAHRDLKNPKHRAEVAAHWGVSDVPELPGLSAVEMFQSAAEGKIKALWIACTNPAQSMPDQSMIQRALEQAEFVVVQEAFKTTATTAFADLLLPASTWGEKMGSVTNSERRISRVRAAVEPAGEAKHDWWIATNFGKELYALLSPQRRRTQDIERFLPYAQGESIDAVEQIWNEHKSLTQGRDLDITGLSYQTLEQSGPQQWPYPQGATKGTTRLYTDYLFPTADGRANFGLAEFIGVSEAIDAKYPFSLNTGRLRDQWHGMSRTGTVGKLFGHVPEPAIQMHPQDIERRRLVVGDLVSVSSRRAKLVLPLEASSSVGLSQAYIPMHWGEEYLSGCSATGSRIGGINALMPSVYCATSKQPELKHAAINVKKADFAWNVFAMAWLDTAGGAEALSVKERLKTLMSLFAFSSCVPFSDSGNQHNAHIHATDTQSKPVERTGLLFRAAALETPPEELILELEGHLGLSSAESLHYSDTSKGQRRTLKLLNNEEETYVVGFLLSGDTSAQSWLRELLVQSTGVKHLGRMLLLPGAKPPVPIGPPTRVICNCLGIRDIEIKNYLNEYATNPSNSRTQEILLSQLQSSLKCGSQCGSCVPELKKLVREHSLIL